ncbi:hypothetical protein SYNTR_2094 [Candidatus Syntrophocurvum alkaliphilum]|uniref:HD-GYP domain-containing protein n=1 Tax=Candidatus Syntrophocurvum alkaliphilum TaxID=2293317 RepID=A0A6I6DP92_9FIRM|nr:HD domain-containing phosphohydrolase [Candidatus Syntrophocurvum alkaliphilum]QGU00688.1 hypothetical protein SYNTR_2094 [Candidatus Syntrophocurvum alkaliphilum]
MKLKSPVLIGATITTVLIVIIIGTTLQIPDWVYAILFFIAGLVITSLFSLNEKRLEQLHDLYRLSKISKELNLSNTKPYDMNEVTLMVKSLIKTDLAFYISNENEKVCISSDVKIAPELLRKSLSPLLNDSKAILIVDINKEERLEKNLLNEEGMKSLVLVPIKLAGETIGFCGGLNKKEVFKWRSVEILDKFCKQLAVLINANKEKKSDAEFNANIIRSLITAVESKNKIFAGHSERVALVSYEIGEKLAMTDEELKNLYYAALLHDIGRINLPDIRLIKDEDEYKLDPIEQHTVNGAACLPEGWQWEEIRHGILYHHERYNGTGYPEGLKMTDIPFIARIIAVADIFDAMTFLCPEEERVELDEALKQVKRTTGTLLDPLAVVAFEDAFEEIRAIYADYKIDNDEEENE